MPEQKFEIIIDYPEKISVMDLKLAIDAHLGRVAVQVTRVAHQADEAVANDTQAACVHNWLQSTNPGVLCRCTKCGAITPLS